MASDYTEHYGLSLWEPGDAFVRSEFNEDNAKMDAALKAVAEETARVERSAAGAAAGAQATAQKALDALMPVSYNVCNLALQQYYEGKETGWKRGLFFDGFLDGTGIASLSPAMVSGNGRLALSRSITANQEIPNGSGYQYSASSLTRAAAVTAPGGGYLYRLKLIWKADSSYQVGDISLEFSFYVNGSLHHAESHGLHFTTTEQTGYIDLTTPVPVSAGDSVHVGFPVVSSYYKLAIVRGSADLVYGVYCFKPHNAVSGTVTTRAAQMPACRGLRAWVRHDGGSVTMTVKAGGVSRALTRTGTRSTMSLQEEVCTETEFKAEAELAAGSLSAILVASLGEDEKVAILDYGVMLL